MTAVLIIIGDEILSGNTVDTNSSFIAGQLKDIGIKVVQILTISDEVDQIISALRQGFSVADLVISTGGLGPTNDDRTKIAYTRFFDDELILDEKTFAHLKALLESRNRGHLLEINRSQAEVPSSARVFQNFAGTAPAFMMQKNGKFAVCLPGVPPEVKHLVREQIIPWLQQNFRSSYLLSRTVSVVNFPESQLAETIKDWEAALPKHVSLSYLPTASLVKLKLTATGKEKKLLEKELSHQIELLRPYISDHMISDSGERIEEIILQLVKKKNFSISVAESCTGGAISQILTSVPGISAFFPGAVVAYSEKQKIGFLTVNPETIRKHTVVSAEVAQEMSRGCQQLFQTDISIATTGVAGPSSDSYGNPVGLVFYSIRIGNDEQTFRLLLPHLDRKDFMNFVAVRALQNLALMLAQQELTN